LEALLRDGFSSAREEPPSNLNAEREAGVYLTWAIHFRSESFFSLWGGYFVCNSARPFASTLFWWENVLNDASP